MSYIEDHCKECEEKLGKPFKEVHKYLDQYAEKTEGDIHRQILHHREGLREILEKFGEEGVKAAELHIMADYGLKYIPSENEVLHKIQAYNQVE